MKALLVVDIQNDFCPGGALAVQGGFDIIPLVNRLQNHFNFIVATQDWHPAQHKSFASQHRKKPGETVLLQGQTQILWPEHCVQGSWGAGWAPGLDTSRFRRVFQKGADPEIDSYSAFFDNGHLKDTGLGDYLKENAISHVTCVGLATDYCVKWTTLDAVKLGFKVCVVEDACRGVELKPGDCARALKEMKAAGVCIASSADWEECQ